MLPALGSGGARAVPGALLVLPAVGALRLFAARLVRARVAVLQRALVLVAGARVAGTSARSLVGFLAVLVNFLGLLVVLLIVLVVLVLVPLGAFLLGLGRFLCFLLLVFLVDLGRRCRRSCRRCLALAIVALLGVALCLLQTVCIRV